MDLNNEILLPDTKESIPKSNKIQQAASKYILRIFPQTEILIPPLSPLAQNEKFLSAQQELELAEHCRSYTDSILVAQHNDSIWLFVPSLYPSSSAVPAFKLSAPASVALKALKDLDICHLTYSQYITAKPRRTSRATQEYSAALSELLLAINRALLCVSADISAFHGINKQRELIHQCFHLLQLCEINAEFMIDKHFYSDVVSQTDIPLFTSFIYTILLLSRECPTITLGALSGGTIAKITFYSNVSYFYLDALNFWEYIAAEKNILFELSHDNDLFTVALHSYRPELSLLGLKQDTQINT